MGAGGHETKSVGNWKKGGYGLVYQDVTRDNRISMPAKGLYAYLSSYCGTSNECYPSVEVITRELGITKDTFYKHINALVAAGVVKKVQDTSNGRFGRTLYRLTHEVEIHSFSFPKKSESKKSLTTNSETNNNSINNNNINNNNSSICPELDKPAPDRSGILLPLIDKSLYDVPLDKITLWRDAYPAVDVERELKKMIAWLEANPKRRKTKRGINAFINTWLSREQDKGGRYRNGGRQQAQELTPEDYELSPEDKELYKGLGGKDYVPEPDAPFQ